MSGAAQTSPPAALPGFTEVVAQPHDGDCLPGAVLAGIHKIKEVAYCVIKGDETHTKLWSKLDQAVQGPLAIRDPIDVTRIAMLRWAVSEFLLSPDPRAAWIRQINAFTLSPDDTIQLKKIAQNRTWFDITKRTGIATLMAIAELLHVDIVSRTRRPGETEVKIDFYSTRVARASS